MKAKPEQINIIKICHFHHFFTVIFWRLNLFQLHCCIRLKFRTSSPPTSCQRLGPCLSTCPSYRSWQSWSLPALKIGRRSRAREREESKYLSTTNHQLKDKFYLLEKTWPNRRYKNCSGWSRDDPDQGGAVFPDNCVATHDIDL